MGNYKGIKIPDLLNGIINHMTDLEESREELAVLGQQWDLLTILGQITGSGTSMVGTQESFKALTEELLSTLGLETLKKSVQALSGQAQVSIDILIRNLFERTADIGFLATDDDIRAFLKISFDSNPDLETQSELLKARFAEYISKYSVYSNIVLMDPSGRVVCSLRDDIKLTESRDPLVQEAISSSASYVETFSHSDLNPQEKQSLIYSYRVTESNDPSSKILGVLSLVFKFENELEMIFKNLQSAEYEWNIVTLLDSEGSVIASSDPAQIPLGAKVPFDVGSEFHIQRFGGRLYLTRTCLTNGYQGYTGLGWMGHAMVPLENAFRSAKLNQEEKAIPDEVVKAATHNESLFTKEIRNIPIHADSIQSDLDRTVWNGNVREDSTKSDNSSAARKVLLWEISATGNKTRQIFEKSISRLHLTAVSSLFSDAAFVSSLSIDIMDRNLYERANDCRWWALTTHFRKTLAQERLSPEDTEACSSILSYINGLYTVYTNIFLFDKNGKILAVSKKAEEKQIGKTLRDPFVKDVLSNSDSQYYSVSSFSKTDLYNGLPTYIYAAPITDLQHNNEVIGGIGIVFDAEPQFKAMLVDALPKNHAGATLKGHYAVLVNREKVVIASSSPQYSPGDSLPIDDKWLLLSNGENQSGPTLKDKSYYAKGVACSKGYREYKGPQDKYRNDVFAITFSELGAVQGESRVEVRRQSARMQYGVRGQASREFATFYIGDLWLGVEKQFVVESIEVNHITPLPGTPASVDGTVLYNNDPICILSPEGVLTQEKCSDFNKAVVLKTDEGLVGLKISMLGEIPEVPESYISPASALGQARNPAIEWIVKPAPNDTHRSMLIILNTSELVKALLSGKSIQDLRQMATAAKTDEPKAA